MNLVDKISNEQIKTKDQPKFKSGDKITVLSQAPLNLSITVSYLEV